MQSWIQRNTFSRRNVDIIEDVQRHNAHPIKMNSSSPNKNPPWDMIWPAGDRNHRTGSNQLQYKYTARIWKIQNFRELCVSTAGTRVLSDTLHVKKEVKYLEKSLASIVFHLNPTKKLGILLLNSAHQVFTGSGRWVCWS